MSAIRELKEQVEQTQTAEFVTTMLRDISATKLQALREVFDTNSAYYTNLHHLMETVKQYAVTKGLDPYASIDESGVAIVALTSNKRFYGGLNETVMQQFAALLQAHPGAAGVIAGKTGELYSNRNKLWQYLSAAPICVDTVADTLDEADTATLISSLDRYQAVYVVHPRFINSFRQEAVMTDITHQPAILEDINERTRHIEYICEPELPALVQFFRTQIRHVLLQRVVLQMQVALTGARLMKMQRARERAEEMVADGRRDLHKQMSIVQSMRLLETFAGFESDRTL